MKYELLKDSHYIEGKTLDATMVQPHKAVDFRLVRLFVENRSLHG